MNDEHSKESLMQRVQAESFAALELQLFLDTHPACSDARTALDIKLQNRAKAVQEFAQRFGSLSLDGMAGASNYHWIDHPWPWEKEG